MKLFTNDSRIKDATSWAEKYLNSNEFRLDVLSVEKFDNSNIDPELILGLFQTFKNPIEIKCTYFGFFYKKVLGKTVGNGFAYVNYSGLGRQGWEVAATVVHEASHVVDEFYPKAYFGHGSNSSKGKKLSFPYFIGERAENWIKREILKKETDRLSLMMALKRENVA